MRVGLKIVMKFFSTVLLLFDFLAGSFTEKRGSKKRRKVFCQITQHLLENHEMWKKVIAEDAQSHAETEAKESAVLAGGTVSDPILSIHEEEEEPGSREEDVVEQPGEEEGTEGEEADSLEDETPASPETAEDQAEEEEEETNPE